MLIQCTSCGTQAKLPSSKEGAKVKCPSCSHVYVARPAGARGGRGGSDPTPKIIAGVCAAVAAFILVIAVRSGGNEPEPVVEEVVEPKKEATVYIDPMTWEGPAVTFARSLHAAAYAANETKISSVLDVEGAYRYVPIEDVAGDVLAPPKGIEMGQAAAGEDEEDAAATEPEEPAVPPTWEELDEMARLSFQDGLIEAVMAEMEDGAVRSWDPYDGRVVWADDTTAVVRLEVTCRDTSADLPDRTTQWTLKNSAGIDGPLDQWRWIHVERWISAEEAAASRRGTRIRAEKKVLSDGSRVYESKIRAIPFDDDVPEARRAELTKLVDDMVGDIDAPPRIRNAIVSDLTLAGKSAVAPLLTKMASIVETMSTNTDENLEDRIRLNFIHEVLTDITRHQTTFKVAEEMGATQERIESGIKQWYGWYDLKYRRFEVDDGPAVDPLLNDPDFQPKTDEERRVYEQAKKAAEEAAKKNDGR